MSGCKGLKWFNNLIILQNDDCKSQVNHKMYFQLRVVFPVKNSYPIIQVLVIICK